MSRRRKRERKRRTSVDERWWMRSGSLWLWLLRSGGRGRRRVGSRAWLLLPWPLVAEGTADPGYRVDELEREMVERQLSLSMTMLRALVLKEAEEVPKSCPANPAKLHPHLATPSPVHAAGSPLST